MYHENSIQIHSLQLKKKFAILFMNIAVNWKFTTLVEFISFKSSQILYPFLLLHKNKYQKYFEN